VTAVQVGFVLVGYLIGSISFARVVAARRIPGVDISETEFGVEGSDETWLYTGVSATSLLDRAGARWGVLVIVLDAVKALVPTLAARLLWPDDSVYLLTAVAVIVGHVVPVWHRFRGGRGQSPMLGAMLVVDFVAIPMAILIAAVIGLVVFTSAHWARDGSPFGVAPWFAVTTGWSAQTVFGLALAAIYAVAIWPDIREERRVRQALGVSSLPWRRRLSVAVRNFFFAEDVRETDA
jgi:glycerol-3-phosphate acyltransferase PlsY